MDQLKTETEADDIKPIKAVNKIVNKAVNELIPYDRNPRVHPDSQIKQLQNSIREWGWTMPILIDEESNVVAGHGRLFAAQDMGISEVPCVVATGWTEEQRKGYVIADNKLSENGQWNDSLYFSDKIYLHTTELFKKLTSSDVLPSGDIRTKGFEQFVIDQFGKII